MLEIINSNTHMHGAKIVMEKRDKGMVSFGVENQKTIAM